MNRLLSVVMISSSLALTVACGSDNDDSSSKSERLSGKSSFTEDGTQVTLPSSIKLSGSQAGCSFELPASFALNAVGTDTVVFSTALNQEPFMTARPTETRLYRGDEAPSREMSATVEENGVQKEIKIFFADEEVSVEVLCLYLGRTGKAARGGGAVSPGYINR